MTDEERILKNKELVSKYPFLRIEDDWICEEEYTEDYSVTKLDWMPEGWRNAFGEMMLDDIAAVLKKADYVDKYHVVQIKEKFGELRWYDDGVPESVEKEFGDLMTKYEHISRYTCIECGKFPVRIKNIGGWIEPLCEECASKIKCKVTDVSEEEFSPVIKIIKHSSHTDLEERSIDCSDIAERIRNKNSGMERQDDQ